MVDKKSQSRLGMYDKYDFEKIASPKFILAFCIFILTGKRNNSWVYFKYHQGMHLKPDKNLQEREAENEKASKDRNYTIVGLWIAVIALVANLLFKILFEI